MKCALMGFNPREMAGMIIAIQMWKPNAMVIIMWEVRVGVQGAAPHILRARIIEYKDIKVWWNPFIELPRAVPT